MLYSFINCFPFVSRNPIDTRKIRPADIYDIPISKCFWQHIRKRFKFFTRFHRKQSKPHVRLIRFIL